MRLFTENNRVNSFYYETDTKKFSIPEIDIDCYAKYLKGIHTNKERFISRWIEPNVEMLVATKELEGTKELTDTLQFFDELKSAYDKVTPYTYQEAFEIKDDTFRALVFGSISINDMINNLGSVRLKVEGIPVKRKQFSPSGEFLGYTTYDNIYETYEVDGAGLGLDGEKFYVVKCWCTSTNKEHFIWIEDQYKDSPLEAIASTFRIHKNLIDHIVELKRQGDILLVELDSDIEPEGDEVVTLTKDQYFNLLTAES